jgi:hypothetical protein
MKYGIYKATLSVGYHGADRTVEIDVRDEYDEVDWNQMSENKQHDILIDWANDVLGQYIDISYSEPK